MHFFFTFTLTISFSKLYTKSFYQIDKKRSPTTKPVLLYLLEYLRGTCVPFVFLPGDVVAYSGIVMLPWKMVLTGKQRYLIHTASTCNLQTHANYCLSFLFLVQRTNNYGIESLHCMKGLLENCAELPCTHEAKLSLLLY